MPNWFDEFIEDNLPASSGPAADTVAPTIAIVSPAPGTTLSSSVEVIADITDATPGNRYQCIVARFPGAVDEITVWRRGQFRGQFAARSWSEVVANGIRLHIIPAGGWPASPSDLQLELDALDGAGNLAS